MHTQGSQHGTPQQAEAYIGVVLPAVRQGLLEGSHLALHCCRLSGGHSCGRAAGAEIRCAMSVAQPGALLIPIVGLLPPADFLQRRHSQLAMCLLGAGNQGTSHHCKAGWMQSHGTAPFVCRGCRCDGCFSATVCVRLGQPLPVHCAVSTVQGEVCITQHVPTVGSICPQHQSEQVVSCTLFCTQAQDIKHVLWQ